MTVDNLNLASLPPEIIFIIAGSDEDSLGEMRLISRSWNVSVLDHLSDNRYKPVLERAYFDTASESDFDDNDDDVPESEARFKMWATVPDRRAGARIGLGKWLRISQAFPGAVEATCNPHKIVETKKERAVYGAVIAEERQRCNSEIQLSIRRLTRFFNTFSSIDLLEIETSPSNNVVGEALKTIGNLRIKRLHIDCHNCSDTDKEVIVDLVRKHQIQHITLMAYYCRKLHFCKFAGEVVQLNATLDIFECGWPQKQKYFRRDRAYWEEKAAILKNDGISMGISFREDEDYDSRLAERGIQFHMRIRSSEKQSDAMELGAGVIQTRGHHRFAEHS